MYFLKINLLLKSLGNIHKFKIERTRRKEKILEKWPMAC